MKEETRLCFSLILESNLAEAEKSSDALATEQNLSRVKIRQNRLINKTATNNLTDGVTALAQLYALYSDRAFSFNLWQRAL